MKKWHITVSGTFTEVYEIEAETAEQAKERYWVGGASELDLIGGTSDEQVEEVKGV